MKTLILSCKIFKPILELYDLNDYEMQYLEIAQHEYPDKLRMEIQKKIDESIQYNQIILLYGLCGNATDGIINTSVEKIYLPRFHDCFGIMMGSYEEMIKITQNEFSFAYDTQEYQQKSIKDYYSYYKEKYGKEDADFIISSMKTNKKHYYIKYQFDKNNKFKKSYDKIIDGKLDIFDAIFRKDFSSKNFLEVYKNQKIISAYNLKDVFKIK